MVMEVYRAADLSAETNQPVKIPAQGTKSGGKPIEKAA
jgi:hypothetical protein